MTYTQQGNRVRAQDASGWSHTKFAIVAAAAVAFCGCKDSKPASGFYPSDSHGVTLIGDISNPLATRTYNFDGGQIYNGRYYLADRNAQGLTVIDVATEQIVVQIGDSKVFPGQVIDSRTGVVRNDLSGPNGLAIVTGGVNDGLVFVGSDTSVAVVDPLQRRVVKTFPNLYPTHVTLSASASSTSPAVPFSAVLADSPDGNRADAGCFDSKHRYMAFAHPDEAPNYLSFYDVDTLENFAVMPIVDALGLEGCVYDEANNTLIQVNDASVANGTGELDILDPEKIAAAKGGSEIQILDPADIFLDKFNIPCNGVSGQGPLGVDLNTSPGSNDAIVGCDPPYIGPGEPFGLGLPGNQQVTVIMDRTTGDLRAAVPVGGADDVAYDDVSNRYFVAARRFTFNGIAQTNAPTGTTFATPVMPSLLAIDANPPYQVLAIVPTGGNAHSVSVDGASRKVFVPYAPGVAMFPGAGISVFSSH